MKQRSSDKEKYSAWDNYNCSYFLLQWETESHESRHFAVCILIITLMPVCSLTRFLIHTDFTGSKKK